MSVFAVNPGVYIWNRRFVSAAREEDVRYQKAIPWAGVLEYLLYSIDVDTHELVSILGVRERENKMGWIWKRRTDVVVDEKWLFLIYLFLYITIVNIDCFSEHAIATLLVVSRCVAICLGFCI